MHGYEIILDVEMYLRKMLEKKAGGWTEMQKKFFNQVKLWHLCPSPLKKLLLILPSRAWSVIAKQKQKFCLSLKGFMEMFSVGVIAQTALHFRCYCL